MSQREALEYVDLIVEQLHEWGVIPEVNYGEMPETKRHELAEMVARKSKE